MAPSLHPSVAVRSLAPSVIATASAAPPTATAPAVSAMHHAASWPPAMDLLL
uniref:Uncharacterized protein n=1 Tax=Arundo donax TaxID=35708 RepID=A0A0A9A1D8_ARUDO